MKYVKLVSAVLLALIAAGVLSGAYLQVRAQQTVVGYLQQRFAKLNLPVLTTRIVQDFPLELEITVRTMAQNPKGNPEDPINYDLIEREVILARQQGYFIENYTILFMNTAGNRVAKANKSIKPLEYLFLDNTPSKVSDAATGKMVANTINVYGMSMEDIGVTSSDGLQTLTLLVSTPTIETANRALPAFMPSLRPLISEINSQGAHIVLCTLEIRDATGNPLLNYILDLQVDSENWWMADGLSMNWFPHPPAAPVQHP